jgi:dolichyl-diphosphooligosaccharide--protein glycosyltransferase
LIFQVPVVALGLGFLVERLWNLKNKWKFAGAAAVVVALLPPAVCLSYCLPNFYRPLMDKSMSAIQAVIDETPAGAVLWTTWWHGYPIQYCARRATITDGGSMGGAQRVYQNLPLACSNERMAANFMQFWIGRGSAGMWRLVNAMNGNHAEALRFLKFVCSSGPEVARTRINEIITAGGIAKSAELTTADDWLKFFFPANVPPFYLLLTQDLTRSREWFRRGTWDPAKRRGEDAFYRRYFGIRLIDGELRNVDGLSVDIEKETILLPDENGERKSFPLTHMVTFTGRRTERTEFGNQGIMCFEWIQPIGYGAAMSPVIAESMFNKLYIRHRSFPRYFRQVVLRSPSFQLWEVKGDSLP